MCVLRDNCTSDHRKKLFKTNHDLHHYFLEKFKINLGKIQNQAKKNEGKNCLQLPLF